ncbi:MAG: DNA translocase FtsK, partial [Bacteriovoracaceae bacterium]
LKTVSLKELLPKKKTKVTIQDSSPRSSAKKKKPLSNPLTALKDVSKKIDFKSRIEKITAPTEKEEVKQESTSIEPAPIQETPVKTQEEAPQAKDKVEKTPSVQTSSAQPGITKESYQSIVSDLSYKKISEDKLGPDKNYFTKIIHCLEEKLAEFKIDGKIINILKGPVVDTFELELGQGVQVSKVTKRQEDLSLALYGAPIRIVYPMRGKSTIGIEVPRSPREIIFLGDILDSDEFQNTKAQLPIAMGKDAFGDALVTDLASMPHMLVAGATGAGKSVFINTLLLSLLIKRSPEELKLILIDPKQLELALYSNLPHLTLPVITDSPTAMNALLWATQEMDRRYSILKDFGVRNLLGYHDKLKTCSDEYKEKIRKYFKFDEQDFSLPYIVVIIDEFADLILTKNGKEIETSVSRLAAKARAAGIHLIVATQRPSVDVITGVIKSNFPTRVSFKVTTGKDSSTILDRYGAEKLLGKGDMLFKQGVETIRVHSSFVEEDEIEMITNSLSRVDVEYDAEALEFLENGGDAGPSGSPGAGAGGGGSRDELYKQALETVLEARVASASMLQRRLRIGYNRAANLIEELEVNGIIGPANGSKGREVLGAKDS